MDNIYILFLARQGLLVKLIFVFFFSFSKKVLGMFELLEWSIDFRHGFRGKYIRDTTCLICSRKLDM